MTYCSRTIPAAASALPARIIALWMVSMGRCRTAMALCLAALVLASAPAAATTTFSTFTTATSPSAADNVAKAAKTAQAECTTARKKRHAKPKFIRSGSDESTVERDRRLSRECKGRPNSGACLGYTR